MQREDKPHLQLSFHTEIKQESLDPDCDISGGQCSLVDSEMTSVKLEDCGQTLRLNVVKYEEEEEENNEVVIKDEEEERNVGDSTNQVEVCKAKWQPLSDSFVKEVYASGSAGGPQKEWKYKDIMCFVLPHLQQRSSRSSLSGLFAEERSSAPLSGCGSDDSGPLTESVPLDSQGPETVSPSPSRPTASGIRDRPHRSRSPREKVPHGRSVTDTRGSHRARRSDVEERLLSILQEPLFKPQTELDESYHFAMSLVPLLNRLDHNRRQQAKIAILNALQNIESSTASSQQPAAHNTPSPYVPPSHCNFA
ncbi:hypothetical protein DPEC_G00135840 [Dallia pectoralis]|uniref:Uncharacterized protein n=1 Tax=Dallia pectoralis TaxID=75939 RepID=A0ACC2GLC1_DALPE|nr:hypothetical protein DPEC_G00135840 [Dallia pectoralis]